MGEKHWTLRGETKAKDRSKNELLEIEGLELPRRDLTGVKPSLLDVTVNPDDDDLLQASASVSQGRALWDTTAASRRAAAASARTSAENQNSGSTAVSPHALERDAKATSDFLEKIIKQRICQGLFDNVTAPEAVATGPGQKSAEEQAEEQAADQVETAKPNQPLAEQYAGVLQQTGDKLVAVEKTVKEMWREINQKLDCLTLARI